MMAFLRSCLHMAFMVVTIIPYAFAVVGASLLGCKSAVVYGVAQRWLSLNKNQFLELQSFASSDTGEAM